MARQIGEHESGRTALFVTARLLSSRLPRKMMTEIMGRPALWYVLERMSVPGLPDLRLLCTSVNPEDEQLAFYAQGLGWEVFRGDEEDVLERYLQAAERHGVHFFVNVDGDDLFCDPAYVDHIIERYRQTDADYIHCLGLPFGGAPIGVKVAALREVCARKEETKTQGWGKYFLQSGLFRTEAIEADESVKRPDYRMTLDYPEDLEFFRETIKALDQSRAGRWTMREIVCFLDAHPEIAAISQQVNEQYWERFNREHGQFSMRR